MPFVYQFTCHVTIKQNGSAVQQSGGLTLGNGMRSHGGAARPVSEVRGYLPTIVAVYLASLMVPAMVKLGPVAMSAPRLLLIIMIIPLVLDLFTGKLGKTYPIDYLFFVFIGWATLALAINNPDRAVEQFGSTSVEFLGGYLLGRAYIRSPQAFAGLIRAGFIIILIAIPFGMLEMKTGVAFWPSVFRKIPLFNAWPDVANPPRMGLERAQVFFSHPIHHGLFCSLFFSLIFVGLRDAVPIGKRIFMTGLVLFGTVMALSSAPLLSILLQIGLITWAYIFRNNPHRWWLLLGLFALMYVTIDLLSNRTPARVLMSYAVFSPQTAYYRAVINEWGFYNVRQNPIFGLGLRDWVRPGYMQRGSVDNFWLLTAMRYGVPGFLILAAGYADAVFRVGLAKTERGTQADNIRQAWTITMAGLSFVLYTVHVWTSIYSFIFFLVGAGLWLPAWAKAQAGAGGSAGRATAPDDAPPDPDTGPRGGLVFSRTAGPATNARLHDPALAEQMRAERDAELMHARTGTGDDEGARYTRAAPEGPARGTPGSGDGGPAFTRFDPTSARPQVKGDAKKKT